MSIKAAIEKKFGVKGRNIEDAINKAEIGSGGGITVFDMRDQSKFTTPTADGLSSEIVDGFSDPCYIVDYPDPPFIILRPFDGDNYIYPVIHVGIASRADLLEDPEGDTIGLAEDTTCVSLNDGSDRMNLFKPGTKFYRGKSR